MSHDDNECIFTAVVVVCIAGFAAWLLFKLLPAMAQAGWMMLR